MIKELRIDICIATFQRNELLAMLLQSLFEQKVSDNIKYRIIVVDNDKKGQAEEVIDKLKKKSPVPIVYYIEPKQNIASARNRSVKLADGDFIIFIDDDEVVNKNWLVTLVKCIEEYKADVVFGGVKPIFPKDINVPEWIIKGGFFEKKGGKTGAIKKYGATCNTIVKKGILVNDFIFKEEFGLTGGSDTELFLRLSIAGYKMVWCDEAMVYEYVLPSRLTIYWLVKRAFRNGQTYARIFVPNMNYIEKIIWCFRRFVFLAFCLVIFPISIIAGKSIFVKCLQKISSNLGQLMGLTGYYYKEYKV